MFLVASVATAVGCFLRTVPDLTSGSDDAGDAAALGDGAATEGGEAGAACPPSKAGPSLVSVPAQPPFPDWCDAYAFCAFAGKRLCTISELRFACTRGGQQGWPYGDTFDGSACNGAELGLDASWPVGSHPSCQGAFPGLFDLVGNIDEWSASCEAAGDGGPAEAICSVFGGFYRTAAATCAPSTTQPRTSNAGFRCCAP